MAWQFSLYSLSGFAATTVSWLVAVATWRERDEHAARPFAAVMIALGTWSLAYGVQLGYTTVSGQLVWHRLVFALTGSVPLLWLVFTLYYAGNGDWLTPRRTGLLAVEPVAAAVFGLTNPVHRLLWSDAALTGAGRSALDMSFHAGYYLHLGYSYLVVVVGLAVLGSLAARATLYRRQIALLSLGAIPPLAASIAHTLGIGWPVPGLDLTPFAFAITGAVWSLGLFRFDLLERTPVARQRVLDEMGDGFVVLDDEGDVVDANAIARRVFDSVAVGAPVTALVDDADSTAGALAALDGRTVAGPTDDQQRAYDVDCSPLESADGDPAGHVVALRDVTERREYEQRLQVVQRVLRHNLRNDLNVIRGRAEHIAGRDGEHADADVDESARRIIHTADELIELSEKTKALVTATGRGSPDQTLVDVADRLARVVAEFRTEYEATVDVDTAPDLRIRLSDPSLFDIAVRNLVENALEHNDADDPWVGVRAEAVDDSVRVRIADNGPGIPAMEREVLEAGVESPLQHGKGIGLWLAYWSVTSAGGTLTFDTRAPRGSVVTLEFPASEPTDGTTRPRRESGASR